MNKRNLAFGIPVIFAALFVVFALIGRMELPTAADKDSGDEKKSPTKKTERSLIVSNLAPSYGPKNAKVTVVEFLDFQCPYSAASQPGLAEIMEEYKNSSVRFMFRQLPIFNTHPYALQAANAALCAQEQKGYIVMQNSIFARQQEIAPEMFTKIAADMGLNLSDFNTCLAERKYQSIIQNDFSDAETLELRGTPTWFINGERIVGALSKEDLKSIIEKHLAR